MTSDPLGGLPEQPEVQPEPPAPPLRRLPRMSTLALLGVLGAFFVAEGMVAGDPRAEDAWTLFRLGALYGPAVQAGDWWRIGSYSFLHIGWIHILMNGAALWALMPQIEATYGPNLAVGIYAATALSGGAASALWSLHREVPVLAAGASGGVFGLFGATAALFWRVRDRLPPEARRQITRGIVTNLVLNAVIAFSGFVDNAAHLGGFASGILFGLIAPLPAVAPRPWHRPVYWMLVASALGLFGMEGAAVAWAARPRPRVLRGDGVVAQVPGMVVPIKPGIAVNPAGLAVAISAGPPEPAEGESVRIGTEVWRRQHGTENPQTEWVRLLAPDGARVELSCWAPQCRGASADRLAEEVAATLRRAP